jgi:hypothetical protein
VLVGRRVMLKYRVLPSAMASIKEAVQQLERDREAVEEFHGSDRFAMITKKGQPAPGKC